MKELTRPDLDYRIENWPRTLQLEFWLNVVVKFLPRYMRALSQNNVEDFHHKREYLTQGYDEVTRRFRVIH